MSRASRRLRWALAMGATLTLVAWLDARGVGRRFWYPAVARMAPRTVADVLADVGPARRTELRAAFRAGGVAYPPPAVRLVAFKEQRRIEVWAGGERHWRRVRDYAVLAASGGPGPKLREGDLQVPEGVYRLTHLNPMSSYHLSIRVDYPNAGDRARAARDGRTSLGGDIYIHGRAVSIGCLAIGDAGIEELFTLVADTGVAACGIVIAPGEALQVPAGAPPWTADLYQDIARELAAIRGS